MTGDYSGGGKLQPPKSELTQIFFEISGVTYVPEQWQLKQIENKLDKILALLQKGDRLE